MGRVCRMECAQGAAVSARADVYRYGALALGRRASGRPVADAVLSPLRPLPTPSVPRQPPIVRRVDTPMAAATADRAATLVRADGRENQSAMKPIAGGPRSMPP